MSATQHISQIYIKHNGAQIAEKYMNALMSSEVDDSVYLPDMFTLVFSDAGLEFLTEDKFKPGDTIEVAMKAAASSANDTPERVKLMEGDIISVQPDLNGADRGTLVIQGCKHIRKCVNARPDTTDQRPSSGRLIGPAAKRSAIV
jgi:hypothetical protein